MQTHIKYRVPKRQVFEEEKKYPWLSILLDSYAICDAGTAIDVERERKKQNCVVACHRGCSNCCLNPDIPISDPEIRGISWYVAEELDRDTQDQLIPRLNNHQSTTECPFLLDHICSIYAVRPIACRIFHVFRKACLPKEEVIQTRRQDIFTQNRATAKKVAMRFLDCDVYGLKSKKEKEQAFEDGIMMRMTAQMHTFDWTRISWAIEVFRNARAVPK